MDIVGDLVGAFGLPLLIVGPPIILAYTIRGMRFIYSMVRSRLSPGEQHGKQ